MTKEELLKELRNALDSVDITFPFRYVFVEAIEALQQSSLPEGIDVTDFCKPIPKEIAEKMPEVIDECIWGKEGQQGLKEAATEYVNGIHYFGDDIELEKEQSKRDFIAGAKWQAGLGVNTNGKVIISHGDKTIEHQGRYGIQETAIPGIDAFNVGDKVIVQIRKKED